MKKTKISFSKRRRRPHAVGTFYRIKIKDILAQVLDIHFIKPSSNEYLHIKISEMIFK